MQRYKNMSVFPVLGIIALALITRLMPHPPNFAPITGIALFSGAYFSDKRWALILPIVCLFITDVFLGFHSLMVVIYGSFLCITAVSLFLNKITLWTVVGASLFFFVVSNFGVWYLYYPHTWEGLVQCYVLALPFYGNSLAGDLFYAAFLFWTTEKLSSLNYRLI